MIRSARLAPLSHAHALARLALAAMVALVLGACQTPPPAEELPEMTFKHLPVLKFNVAAIDIIEEFRSSGQEPNVEQRWPVPPAEAAKRWAADRLQAVGRAGSLTVLVQDGAVIERKIPKSGGLTGLVKIEQTEEYTATVAVTIQVRRQDGSVAASATAMARRLRTTPENLSVTERRRIWYDMAEQLMADFNAEIEPRLKGELGTYLSR